MKTLILLMTVFSSHLFASDYKAPTKHADRYLVVGIAGFKTGRDVEERDDIYSEKIGSGSEPSGAWTHLNKYHPKIVASVYLSHYSKDSELDKVMDLMLDSKGECLKDQGMIFLVNSWGAKLSQKLAKRYYKKCGKLPHLTITIDAVSKPTPFAYNDSIYAYNCVNFYQRASKLKGTKIENCLNYETHYQAGFDLFNAHIYLEWEASKSANILIERYLNESLPVMFVRDEYKVDYLKGL